MKNKLNKIVLRLKNLIKKNYPNFCGLYLCGSKLVNPNGNSDIIVALFENEVSKEKVFAL